MFHKKANGTGPLAQIFDITNFLTAIMIMKSGNTKQAQRNEFSRAKYKVHVSAAIENA
jgi:hypothetical protein